MIGAQCQAAGRIHNDVQIYVDISIFQVMHRLM